MSDRTSPFLLILCALPEEALPLRRLLSPDRVRVGVTGDGGGRAAGAARRLIERTRPGAVLVAGLAGALTPGVERGEVILAREVVAGSDLSRRYAPPPDFLELGRGTGLREGTLVSAPRLVAAPDDRRRLLGRVGPRAGDAFLGGDRRSLDGSPVLVDLETVAYVSAAEAAGVPWLAIRAVSDGSGETLPPALPACQGDDGSVSRWSVLARVLSRPWELPELLGFAVRARRCADRLATAAVPVAAAMEAWARGGTTSVCPTAIPDGKGRAI